ncbi:hypothetical protein [Streptomyces sp. NPDC088766]|uniref:hypothetical protein n=1 Tax=Streptomyces sp. NPDC088766 TaxID=3365893 RepID=UPI0037F9D144
MRNRHLDHRNRLWLRTADLHLFVSQTTGCGAEPVSHVWNNDVLSTPTGRLREDRLLHEAKATGGDPRRICDLFGPAVGAALRHTGTVAAPHKSRRWLSGGELFVDGVDVEAVMCGAGVTLLPA